MEDLGQMYVTRESDGQAVAAQGSLRIQKVKNSPVSTRMKKHVSQPPPLDKGFTSGRPELDLNSYSLFSDKLIAFLLVSFSLLSVFLAASILLVLSSNATQVSRRNESTATESLPSSVTKNNADNAPVDSLNHQGLSPEPRPHVTDEFNLTKEDPDISHDDLTKRSVENELPPQPQAIVKNLIDNFELADLTGTPDNHFGQEFAIPAVLVPDPNRSNHEKPIQPATNPEPEICSTELHVNTEMQKKKVEAPFYGTRIKWNRSVEKAAGQAKSENKLVLLMHVSGNFTKEEFT